MLPVASQMPSSSATSPAQTLRDDADRTARRFVARGGAQRRKARSLAGARANQSKSRILMARLPCVWTKRSRKKQKSTRIEVLWGRRFALSSACLSPRNPRKQSESGARGEAASVETERQARIAEGEKSHCGREEKNEKTHQRTFRCRDWKSSSFLFFAAPREEPQLVLPVRKVASLAESTASGLPPVDS